MLHVELGWILYLIMSIVDCYLALCYEKLSASQVGLGNLNAAAIERMDVHRVAVSHMRAV